MDNCKVSFSNLLQHSPYITNLLSRISRQQICIKYANTNSFSIQWKSRITSSIICRMQIDKRWSSTNRTNMYSHEIIEKKETKRENKIEGHIPVGPPAPGLSSVTTLSSSLLDSPLSRRSLSGLLAITEVLFDGIGKDGFGRPCIAAKACCTASWRTSVYFRVE